MKIYGSEGAIVYFLDAAQGMDDEIEACLGDNINAKAYACTKLHIPEYYRSGQTQSFVDIINGMGKGKAACIQDGQANQHVVDAILSLMESGKWVAL